MDEDEGAKIEYEGVGWATQVVHPADLRLQTLNQMIKEGADEVE